MRFLSKYGRYGVQIRPIQTESFASGITKVTQEPLYALFREGDLRPEERELAIDQWTFNGFYQEQDEVTMVPPDYRIGVFDSRTHQINVGWSDEDREHVERELVRLSQTQHDILVVPATMVPPPWPRYDDFAGSPEQLLDILTAQGHDLTQTLAYEQAMQNRPEIVLALEQVINGTAEEFLPYNPNEETVVG